MSTPTIDYMNMPRPLFHFQKPYTRWTAYGPYYCKSDNRWIVELKQYGQPVYTATYARYLMEIHLGRYLTRSEHVHHKDENRLNDSLENLELLPQAQHIRKHKLKYKYCLEVKCMCCGNLFVMNQIQQERFNLDFSRTKNPGPYCSKSCGMKVAWMPSRRRSDFHYAKFLGTNRDK